MEALWKWRGQVFVVSLVTFVLGYVVIAVTSPSMLWLTSQAYVTMNMTSLEVRRPQQTALEMLTSQAYITMNMTSLEVRRPQQTALEISETFPPPLISSNISLVLMLSYQRTGSTFIGHVLRDIRSSFFLYEPLDPLFTAMYGTAQGQATPDDIFFERDGTHRIPTEEETAAVLWTLQQIYACQMSSFPPAMLLHVFWKVFNVSMPVSKPYVNCVNSTHPRYSHELSMCLSHISSRCGGRFNHKTGHRNGECFDNLWGGELSEEGLYHPKSLLYTEHVPETAEMPSDFRKYFNCIRVFSARVKYCAEEFLDKPCRASAFRGVKTVRAWMEVAEYFLVKFPTFRLMHSYRDPRGAVSSRWAAKWSQGKFCRKSVSSNAHCYCAVIVTDRRKREILEREFPGRIFELYYDDFAVETEAHINAVYDFLDQSLHRSSVKQLNRKTNPNIVSKWEDKWSTQELRQINKTCRSFFLAENRTF